VDNACSPSTEYADFLTPLKKCGLSISMDGRGRAWTTFSSSALELGLIYPGDFDCGIDLSQRRIDPFCIVFCGANCPRDEQVSVNR
jgi:hypothetical protein